MRLFAPKTNELPRLGVRPADWDGHSCRLGLYDTELEAWQKAIAALEDHRNRWADVVRLAERQVQEADMWLSEYRRNLSTNMLGSVDAEIQ